jgi:hypothetical protein
MDIDQDGSLLAAGFTGKDQGFLRVFFADNLLAGTSAFREGLADPLTRTIDEFVLSPRRLFHRVDWNAPKPLDAPRDLEFMPQISVLAPRAGETVRGAVAVNVVTRDERIGEIRCALTPGVEPGPRFASGGSLTTMQKGLGHSWRAGPGSAQRPICFFADLTTGDYVLEVRGVRGDREAVVRVPFRYER